MKAVLVSVVVFCFIASVVAQDGEQAPVAAAAAPVQTQTIVHTDPAVTNSLNQLLESSRGQSEALRNDLNSAVNSLREQAGQSNDALRQQQEKLQELSQAVQQQAAAGAELKNSLSTLHTSVSALQQQLREQSQTQSQSQAAAASSQSDSRLSQIESELAAVKTLLNNIVSTVSKEQERAATLTATIASNHNVTQTLIQEMIARVQNSSGGSFAETLQGLSARVCDWYHAHLHPYTKDVVGKASELGSQAADWSKQNGADFIQNAPHYAQKTQKLALKQYSQTHDMLSKLVADTGIPKEHAPLASHVALVSLILFALTIALLLVRLTLSALCGMCCRKSRKSSSPSTPLPVEKQVDQSPAKDAAGKNQRAAKPASHRS